MVKSYRIDDRQTLFRQRVAGFALLLAVLTVLVSAFLPVSRFSAVKHDSQQDLLAELLAGTSEICRADSSHEIGGKQEQPSPEHSPDHHASSCLACTALHIAAAGPSSAPSVPHPAMRLVPAGPGWSPITAPALSYDIFASQPRAPPTLN